MLRGAIVTIALLPFSVIGTRLGLFDFRVGLLCFVLSAIAGVFIILVTAVATRKQKEEQAKRKLSQAAVISAIPVVLVAMAVSKGSQAPPIHDITTDLNKPPQFQAAEDRRNIGENSLEIAPATLSSLAKHYPELAGHKSSLAMHEALLVAAKTAESLNWKIYYINEQASVSQFEAVDTTLWFGFKDDIAVRLSQVDSGTMIDLRSASRVGRSDLGANAQRIKDYIQSYKALEQQVTSRAADATETGS